ncbi:outer membrane beta-barrel protein [Lutibacter citreus]|uniref:outer membrane beta-barrel protein n=1 Tax=Lutibacter citreus TaxID=2138210 RepID=UPI000DBEA6DE|nr:outer membrane beta-barrel protein [Lutibacter citreus]
MKKSLFITLFFAVTILFAQEKDKTLTIKQGTWNFGGGISLSVNNNESIRENGNLTGENLGFTITPKFGYAINNNLVIGLGTGYSYNKSSSDFNNDDAAENEQKIYSFSLIPYIKKHFGIGEKVSINLQGNFEYTRNWNDVFENNSSEYNYKSNNYFIGIRPGITYFINKNFALEAQAGSLGYSHTKSEQNNRSNSTKSNSFRFNLNTSSLSFGLSYYL